MAELSANTGGTVEGLATNGETSLVKIAVLAGLIPVATLSVGGIVGKTVVLPDQLSSSFSYMTTGLLVALVSIELMPEILTEAKKKRDRGAAVAGLIGAAAALIALLACVETEKKKELKDFEKEGIKVVTEGVNLVDVVTVKTQAFPVASVVSWLIILWMYGLIIGVGPEVALNTDAAKTLALITASAISIDTFLIGVEASAEIKRRGRPWWESMLVSVSGAALLLGGSLLGGKLENARKHGNSSVGYFIILGIALASSLSLISQSQRATKEVEERNEGKNWWYPPIFLYVGFLIILHIQWYAKQFKK